MPKSLLDTLRASGPVPAHVAIIMALISVNLAVLNLLPIPVLDGGQILFVLAEGVLGKPLPLKLREKLTLLGLAIVGTLMALAFWNDIRRIFEAWGR